MTTINYDLLEFHVCEASQELDLFLDSIRHARNELGHENAVGNEPLYFPLHESALAASLEHAYHHLNFAWNARFKTMGEADAQFSRNEKFPRPNKTFGWFAKFWPKSIMRKNIKRS